MKIKINNNWLIFFLIFFSILKFFFAFYFGDLTFDKEWSVIYKNLKTHNEFSYHNIDGVRVPSVYMPPLYAYFLYIFSFLSLSDFETVKIIILTQCILSGISIIFFYKLLSIFFESKISAVISILYFLYPLNFYSASQISSVSLQSFLFIVFCYYFFNTFKFYNFIVLGIVSGLLILIRGEFWLLLLICFLFKIYQFKLQRKKYLISFFLCMIIISPQLIRNYSHFDKIILTKSSGINLWRGNSHNLNINGDTIENKEMMIQADYLKKKLLSQNKINVYEIKLDDIYFKEAVSNIKNNTITYAVFYLKKFFAFAIFNYNSSYPNYYNPMVFIPEILISIFAIIGFIQNFFSNKRNLSLSIILLYYLFLIPVFFILPRYKLFILPIYFIYFGFFLNFLSQKYFLKKTVQEGK